MSKNTRFWCGVWSKHTLLKLKFVFLLLSFCLLPAGGVKAQVTFAQITDPHLFDESNDRKDSQLRSNQRGELNQSNSKLMSAVIKQINADIDNKVNYELVVVTGDIGIEKLVDPSGKFSKYDMKSGEPRIDDEVGKRLNDGANEFANLIRESKVKTWLFLPGNNDLLNESPDTITYYRFFITLLTAKLSNKLVIDLSPLSENSFSGVYHTGNYSFIGFNNSSFKDNGKISNAKINNLYQKAEIERVRKRVTDDSDKFVFILYHIPEIDDPFLARNGPDVERKQALDAKDIDDIHLNSSWVVARSVWTEWEELLKAPNVRALFAGHFHDPDRQYYQSLDWLSPGRYLPDTVKKLFVCPPIAEKYQPTNAAQARGFVRISIDVKGSVIGGGETSGSQIYWYSEKDGSLTPKEISRRDGIGPPTTKSIGENQDDQPKGDAPMFGSEILDVAIGIIFVFLVVSLICSVVNEIIAGFTKWRASDLERGLKEMLQDPEGTKIIPDLYNHPLINSLFKGKYKSHGWKLPSYIPSKTFALALLDVFLPDSAGQAGGANKTTPPSPTAPAGGPAPAVASTLTQIELNTLRNAIATNPRLPDSVSRALLPLVSAAGDDANKIRENIENWFDKSMERVSGWYKRKTQIATLIIGLLIAILLNVDTVAITRKLYTDKATREVVVKVAQDYLKAHPPADTKPNTPPSSAGASAGQSTGTAGADKKPDTTPPTAGATAGQSTAGADKKTDTTPPNAATTAGQSTTSPGAEPKSLQNSLADLKPGLDEMEKLHGLPIGRGTSSDGSDDPTYLRIIGYLLTALAASLGAPFWFDMLSKVMSIRSSVKPQPPQSSGSKP